MGAWGIGNLDNDTASDFIGDFRDNPSSASLVEILVRVNDTALSDKYLDASDCEEALVAVEIIAASRKKPVSNFPDDIRQLVVGAGWEKFPDYEKFLNLAVRAVWFIREESELQELWEEAGELEEWREVQENLLKRLE
ncbi:DUF4259 domain-containing protein [Hymenobacter negativus]|uniref:DUF4259 domain-containing protein n=1 Tax=Hymenobacter negativus TaxID=2795026 RepID=A0ABS0Q3Z9_9BACT|nr:MULTISPECIES: DUF4259 domain-containing protein [Bacteria]MBH8557088.1 DUF4259 domain-containing protein [Hymenobacter negativus]MBH8569329.1 DUF4259 domain-containing protein [Hymenobacter negativus]MBR7209063.1 DUF4259 domain-containing protein [Microvirga sp. STS02]